MKLNKYKDWKAVIFTDRTILKKDLQLMSAEQIRGLTELEVEPTKRKGYYKAK